MSYVIAAYGLVIAALAGYAGWLQKQRRTLEASAQRDRG